MHNIKPCFWGKKYWGSIFAIAAVYPQVPDYEYVSHVKMFLLSLRKVLPCASCRESYGVFSTEPDTDITNNEFYIKRENFIILIHRIREKVNKKIGLEYKISVNYFTQKLNKMLSIEDNNIDSYINNLAEAPFIQESIKTHIYDYMLKNKKKIHDYNPKYTDFLTNKLVNFIEQPNFNLDDKNFRLLLNRNDKCRYIINKVYNNMTNGNYGLLESFFKDKALHLNLFYMGCSIIPLDDLKHIFEIE